MKVLLVDDHALFAPGRGGCSALPGVQSSEAGRDAKRRHWCGQSGPYWSCSISTFPGLGGLDLLRRVAEGGRYIKAEIAQELALQATKTGDPMTRLTERDVDILRLLGNGQSLSNSASLLGVSYKTVANTCNKIKAKLGITWTVDFVRLSTQEGITGSDSTALN